MCPDMFSAERSSSEAHRAGPDHVWGGVAVLTAASLMWSLTLRWSSPANQTEPSVPPGDALTHVFQLPPPWCGGNLTISLLLFSWGGRVAGSGKRWEVKGRSGLLSTFRACKISATRLTVRLQSGSGSWRWSWAEPSARRYRPLVSPCASESTALGARRTLCSSRNSSSPSSLTCGGLLSEL